MPLDAPEKQEAINEIMAVLTKWAAQSHQGRFKRLI
jgi:hypothetical protein